MEHFWPVRGEGSRQLDRNRSQDQAKSIESIAAMVCIGLTQKAEQLCRTGNWLKDAEYMALVVISPRRFEDSRGWFSETWSEHRFREAGVDASFCQDNHSLSRQPATLRGLHFQKPPHAQAKLVRCLRGRVFDVAVDVRKDSPTYGNWAGLELSAENGKQLYIPAGYAHGFVTLEPDCEIAYKVDDFYSAQCDGGIAWNDPAIAIAWPLDRVSPILSEKDAMLPNLTNLDVSFPYDGNPLGPLREVTL